MNTIIKTICLVPILGLLTINTSVAETSPPLSNQLLLNSVNIVSSCPKFGRSNFIGSYTSSSGKLDITNTLTQCTLNSGEIHDGLRTTSGTLITNIDGYKIDIKIIEDLSISSQDRKSSVKYHCDITKVGKFDLKTNQFIGKSSKNCNTDETTLDSDSIAGYILKEVDLGFIRTNRDQVFKSNTPVCSSTKNIKNKSDECENDGSIRVSDDQKPVPVPVITSFTASPNPVNYNGAATLQWSTSNATSCSSNAWNGSVGGSGSLVVSGLTSNQTYTLTCSGSGGFVSSSTTVQVTPKVAASLVINWCGNTKGT